MVNTHLIMENSINLQDKGKSNIELVPSNKQKDFYVFYDEYNGSISRITTQKQSKNQDPYIIDTTGLAKQILEGTKGIGKCAVGYKDYEANELTVLEKTNLINFVKRDAELYIVPIRQEHKGITFVYYKDSQLLEIEFNAIVLGNYNSMLWRNQFKLAFDEQFIIYLTDKKDPDQLEARFVFPLANIFEEGSVLVPNFTIFDSSKMDICIKRHFRDYSLIIRDKFVETDYHRNKLGRLNMVKEFIEGEPSHIDLIQEDDASLMVDSHLLNTKQVGQYEKQLKFYICNKEDPDEYEAALTFDWGDLIPKKLKHYNLPSNIKLDNKLLLYDGTKLKITFREENNNVENTDN